MSTAISNDDRGWAILAHISGLAGYLAPLGGVIVPIILMFAMAERPTVARIAKQALLLNIAIWAAVAVGVAMLFTVVLIPVAWLIFAVATPIAVVLPVIGAIQANEGRFWRYPVVGSWV